MDENSLLNEKIFQRHFELIATISVKLDYNSLSKKIITSVWSNDSNDNTLTKRFQKFEEFIEKSKKNNVLKIYLAFK